MSPNWPAKVKDKQKNLDHAYMHAYDLQYAHKPPVQQEWPRFAVVLYKTQARAGLEALMAKPYPSLTLSHQQHAGIAAIGTGWLSTSFRSQFPAKCCRSNGMQYLSRDSYTNHRRRRRYVGS